MMSTIAFLQPAAHFTMASKLVPFAFRSASRALRVQRPQWRAFSVSQTVRSDNLMVVSTSSLRLQMLIALLIRLTAS